MNRHVFFDTEQAKEALRWLNAKIAHIDLSIASQQEPTILGTNNLAPKRDDALNSGNAQRTIHPNLSISADDVIAEDKRDRRIRGCAQSLEEV